MKYGYTTTTTLYADYDKKSDNNNARVIPFSEVKAFTVSIDSYIKLFGTDRASRLEKKS